MDKEVYTLAKQARAQFKANATTAALNTVITLLERIVGPEPADAVPAQAPAVGAASQNAE